MKIFTLKNVQSIKGVGKFKWNTKALVLMAGLMILGMSSWGQGLQNIPVTEPSGGFEIDGNVRAGTTNGWGDWFKKLTDPSPGFVFNDDGTSSYTDHLLLIKDGISNTDKVFSSANFNGDPNLWTWKTAGASPPKANINNAMFFLGSVEGTGGADSKQWLFVAADREAGNGTAYLDIEFLQNPLVTTGTGSSGGFSSTGPNGGRTENDMLIQVEYPSGGTTAVTTFYLWKNVGGVWQYVLPTGLPSSGIYWSASNAGTVSNLPSVLQIQGNSYAANEFVEVAVNMTDLFRYFDPCLWIKVKTIMIKTRSTESSNNAVDFVQPVIQSNIDLGTAINYNDPFCPTGGTASVTQVGEKGGKYSSSDPAVLYVNPSTGLLTLPTSSTITTTTTVTISYEYVPVGCSTQTVSTAVVINPFPTFTTKNITVCPGTPADLIKAVAPGGTPDLTYTYWLDAGASTSPTTQTTTISRTYYIKGTTAAGCSYIGSTTVSFADNTAPVISNCPNNITQLTGSGATSCARSATWTKLEATDDCTATGSLAWTESHSSGATFPVGTTTVTYTVKDSSGNTSTCTFTVTVVDNTAPVIAGCPTNIITTNDPGACGALVSWTEPTATDNCTASGSLVWTKSQSPGSTFSVGTTTVTYTVKDSSGNTSTCTFTVTVVDNTAPVIAGCPTNITVNTGLVRTTCDQVASWAEPTATDNCTASGNLVWNKSYLPGATFLVGTTTVTYTVKDSSGNTSTCTFTVMVVDNTAPVISGCSSNITVNTGIGRTTCDQVASWTEPTATDNCTVLSNSNWTKSHLPGATFPVGTTTVTYTVKDSFGNTSTCTFTVTVIDNTAPVIAGCPTNITTTNDPGACGALVSWTEPTATDNCTASGSLVWTKSHTPGSTFPVGSTLVTYTARDAAGNTSLVCSFTVTVNDSEKPVISGCPSNITVNTGIGRTTCDQVASWAEPTATDNCTASGNLVWNKSHSSGATFLVGTTTVTYTVKDSSGNTSTCTFTVMVVDNTAPVISGCSSNITVNTGIGRTTCDQVASWAEPTATDNCTASGNLVWSKSHSSGATFPVGTTTVTYTVKDSSGNTSTCTFTVTVIDNTVPTFVVPESTIVYKTLTCIYDINSTLTGKPTDVKDNCDSSPQVTYLDVIGVGTCIDEIVITRTWKVEDYNGNTTTKTQTITIKDNAAPTFTVPASAIVYKDASCNYTVLPAQTGSPTSVLDNCDTSPAVTYTDSAPVTGLCADELVLTRTWKVEDNCGNITTKTQTITIKDNTAPTFTVPASAIVYKDASCNYTVLPAQTGSPTSVLDNCDTSPAVTYTDSAPVTGLCADELVLTRTWKVEDNCGNITTKTQTITIKDNTAPTFTVPASAIVYKDASCNYTVLPAQTGSPTSVLDNCDTSPAVTYTDSAPATGLCADELVITRTWKVEDNCGNITTKTQTITIKDNTAPTFTVPASAIVYKDASCNYTVLPAQTGSPTSVLDNCDTSPAVTYTDSAPATGLCADELVITRTWKVEDNCGNITTKTQTITIKDNTAPTFTVPASAIVYKDASCNYTVLPAQTGSPTSVLDNCDTSPAVTYTDSAPATGLCADELVITRTWKVEDNCGNITTKTQTITIKDNTAPTFTVPASAIVYKDASCNYTVLPAQTGSPTSVLDNCDTSPLVTYTDSAPVTGLCADELVLTRTWKVEDNCGNITTKTQTITIKDNTAPTFTVPASAIVYKDASCNYTVLPAQTGSPTSVLDNCDTSPLVTYTDSAPVTGLCADELVLTRTWKVEDNCGNITTKTQTITIKDNTAPTFTVPASAIVYKDASCNYTVLPAQTGSPTSVLDNCDTSPLVTYTDSAPVTGLCADELVLTRTWKVEDNCGNITTKTQTITIKDNTAPTFTVPASAIVYKDASCNYTVLPAQTGSPTSVLDNCDTSPLVTYTDSAPVTGLCADELVLTRTWKVEDNCGNITTKTQTITIKDNTAPTFTVPASAIVYKDASCNYTVLPAQTGSPTSVLDNCDTSPLVTYTDSAPVTGLCADELVLTRTWKVEDNCGNTTTKTQTITIKDNAAPIISGSIPVETVQGCSIEDAPSAATSVSELERLGLNISDNCTSDTNLKVTSSFSFNGACPIVIKRVYTITDACNNSTTATATQIIEVNDKQVPIITGVPGPITYSCASLVPVAQIGTVSVTDNCIGEVSVTVTDVTTSGSCTNKFTIARTWTAVDVCGNISSATQIITVDDQIPPTITGVPRGTDL